jgi:hypothetical protein
MLTKAQKTNEPEASRSLVWEIRSAAQFLFDLAERLRDQRSDHCAEGTDDEWDLAVRDEAYAAWRHAMKALVPLAHLCLADETTREYRDAHVRRRSAESARLVRNQLVGTARLFVERRDVEAYAAMRATHGAETAEFVRELLDFMLKNRLLDG